MKNSQLNSTCSGFDRQATKAAAAADWNTTMHVIERYRPGEDRRNGRKIDVSEVSGFDWLEKLDRYPYYFFLNDEKIN